MEWAWGEKPSQRGDRRRKGSLTLRSLFAHSGLMSFAPQGGVSEASASRSSHPFRRSSGRNGTSERKREREVSERPASSITSSGHRLSPPSCDHCWWLKGLDIRKIWEVNLGFHGRFLPVYHLFPSSTRFLSSYLRSSGCRSSTSLSIHLLRRNEGTEVSEWRTEEGKNGVRNGLYPSFTSPFFPRSYVTRLVTLTSFLGADWVE